MIKPTINKEKLVQVIFLAVDEINQNLPEEQQIHKSINTILFGNFGKLDSLVLVSLIVAIEEAIEEKMGISITIADERAMSQKDSPFRTIGMLADYIALLFEENQNG